MISEIKEFLANSVAPFVLTQMDATTLVTFMESAIWKRHQASLPVHRQAVAKAYVDS